jgi:hypothetical protein
MSAYTERLCRQADALLNKGELIPVDLFAKLAEAGIDVTTLERNHAAALHGALQLRRRLTPPQGATPK